MCVCACAHPSVRAVADAAQFSQVKSKMKLVLKGWLADGNGVKTLDGVFVWESVKEVEFCRRGRADCVTKETDFLNAWLSLCHN